MVGVMLWQAIGLVHACASGAQAGANFNDLLSPEMYIGCAQAEI